MCAHPVASVFLVEDSQPVRDRLKELLALDGGTRIVGESDNAAAAIDGIPVASPDFVVLDYQLPDGSGLDVLRGVRHAVPRTRFIVLTNHASDELRDAFVQAGALCLLDKSYEFGRLAGVIATSLLQEER
jgi:two-component system, NarL family, response regulator DevR